MVTPTSDAESRLSRRYLLVVAASATVAFAAVLGTLLWRGSLVGTSGVVTVETYSGCANPAPVAFHGYSWVATAFAPETWPVGGHEGRFTVQTLRTARFVSATDHVVIDFARLPKGAFSTLECAIR